MKTSRIIIVIVPVAIVVGVILYFANSIDFTPSTKENPFGIQAKLVHSENYLPFMCPIEPCVGTHFSLEITSEKDVFFRGYNICNGITCVKSYGSNLLLKAGVPTENQQVIGVFGIESWKTGDTVNIRLKVTEPISPDNYFPDESKLVFLDLGESKIESKLIEEKSSDIKETMLSDLSIEEKKSKIIDKYYSNNREPFAEMAIELKKEYQQGEKITFRLAHFGYTNWCLLPTLAIFHEDYDKPIVNNSIVHTCPAPGDQYAPILGIFTQDDFPIELTCKYQGTYTIFGSAYKLEPSLIGQYYCNSEEKFEPPREIDIIIPNGASDPNRTRNFEPNEIHLKWGDYVKFTNNDSVTHIVFGETNKTIRFDGAEFYVTLEPGRSDTIQMLTNGEHWIYSQDADNKKFSGMSGTIFVD